MRLGATQIWTEPQALDAVIGSIKQRRKRRIRLGLINPSVTKIRITCSDTPTPIPISRPEQPRPVYENLTTPQKFKFIDAVVSRYFNLTLAEIHSERRWPQYLFPRQIAQYLQRKHTLASHPCIGRHWGHDHTTIISSHQKIARVIAEDIRTAADVENIERQLGIYHGVG